MIKVKCDPSARNESHVGSLHVEKMGSMHFFFVKFRCFKAYNYHFKAKNGFDAPILVRNDI